MHGRLCPCTTQHMAASARKHTSNDTRAHTHTHTHTRLPSRSSYTSLFSTVACAHGESFVEVIGWVYTGRCWILFAEDSDKRPSTSFPLATSRRLPATVPTPCAISPSLHDTFASSTSSFSISLCPLPSRARRARNVTSISSSGPTPRLWQPSRGASGDCETGHCSRRSGTLAFRCDATPDSRFRLIRDNFLRSRINPRSVRSVQSRRTKVFQRLPWKNSTNVD